MAGGFLWRYKEKLSESTGFTNLVLPDYGAKDCSDLFKLLNNVNEFRQVIFSLINGEQVNIISHFK